MMMLRSCLVVAAIGLTDAFAPLHAPRQCAASTTRLFVGLVGEDGGVSPNSNAAPEALLRRRKAQAAAALQKGAKVDTDALAAAAGGAVLGAGLAATSNPDLVAPAALLGAGAALGVSTQEGEAGRVTKEVLGAPTKRVGSFLVRKMRDFVQEMATKITNLPNAVADMLKQQAERTRAEIAALPQRLLSFFKMKATEAADEVQRWPQRWMEALRRQVQEAGRELEAAPARLAATAQKSLDEAVREAKELPGRKMEEFVRMLEGEDEDEASGTAGYAPQPPQMPPPAQARRRGRFSFRKK